MLELIRREFTVDAPLATAWQHLADVEAWPSWAKHIIRIELKPAGELTLQSAGTIHLRNGMRSRFQMTAINPLRNWQWVGPFLWMTVHYDHWFDEVDPQRTRMTFLVQAEGFGASVLGRLFAVIYNKNLDVAIPHLVDEMKRRNWIADDE